MFIETQLVHCHKLFGNCRLSTVFSSVNTIINMKVPSTRCCKSLYVIVASDTLEARNVLRKIMEERCNTNITWLLVPLSHYPMHQFYTEIHSMSFNCNMLVATSSRMEPNFQLQALDYTSMAAQNGSQDWKQPFYKGKADLNGVTLRAVTKNDIPLIVIKEVDGRTEISGFVGELWKLLEEMLNFRTELITDGGLSSGITLKNGTCTGMVGAVQEGRADIALTLMKLTPSRERCGQWVTPWAVVSLRIFVNVPEDGSSSNEQRYASAFTHGVWLSIIACILLLGCCLAATFYTSPTITESKRRTFSGHAILPEAMLGAAAAIICQQGYHRKPVTYSACIIILLCYMTGVILMTSYSSRATSYSAIKKTKLPFTSLQQMNEDGTYQLSMIANSSSYYMFRMSRSGLLKDFYEKQMDHDRRNYPMSLAKGIKKVCSDEKYTFLGPYELMRPVLNRANCNVIALPEPFSKYSFGLLLRKSSPHLRPINNGYLKVWEGGLRSCLMRRFLQSAVHSSSPKHHSVTLKDIGSLLITCALGCVLALFILAAEVTLSFILKLR